MRRFLRRCRVASAVVPPSQPSPGRGRSNASGPVSHVLPFSPPLPGEGWGGGTRRLMKRSCVASAVVPPSSLPPEGERSNASGPGVPCLVFLPPLAGEGWGGGTRRLMKRGFVASAVVPPSQPSPGRGRSNASGPGVPCLVFLPPLPGEGWGGGTRRSLRRCVASAVVPPSQPPFPRKGKEQCIRPRCPMSCLSPSPSGGGLGWGHGGRAKQWPDLGTQKSKTPEKNPRPATHSAIPRIPKSGNRFPALRPYPE
jgi:hypothetical protein